MRKTFKVVACVFAVVLAAAPVPAEDVQGRWLFGARPLPNASSDPRGIVVEDFDGDGFVDFAVAERFSGDVVIMFGGPDVLLSPPVYYPVGSRPYYLTTANLNGDAHLDLAVSNRDSDDLSVLLGNGDGTFGPTSTFDAGGAFVGRIVAGDVTGDGLEDVLVCAYLEGDVILHEGNGDGTFDAPVPVASTGYKFVALAHLNGDSSLDLVSDADDQVGVRLADGLGGLLPAVYYDVGEPSPYSVGAVAVADFDDDGALDLAVTNDVDISILMGAGDGTFAPEQRFAVDGYPWSIVADDLNADGIDDLLVGGSPLTVLTGIGDGSFDVTFVTPVLAGPALAVADLDENGHRDLVSSGTGITYLPGKGNGTFDERIGLSGLPSGSNQYLDQIVTDLDRDGLPDRLFLYETQGLQLMHGRPDGSFVEVAGSTTLENPVDMAVGDFNGDDWPDAVVIVDNDEPFSTEFKRIVIVFNLGDGTFAPVAVGAPAIDDHLSAVATGHFNGDPHLDVVVADEVSNQVTVLLGQGDGSFVTPFTSFAVGDGPFELITAAIDQDADVDLLVRHAGSGDTRVYLGNGTGGFQLSATIPDGADTVRVFVAEVDGDSFVDLIRVDRGADQFAIFPGNGDGTFQSELVLPTDRDPMDVKPGDFDRDGILDLAVATSYEGTRVFFGNGDGTYEIGSPHLPSLSFGFPSNELFSRDFDLDGWTDLLVRGILLFNLGGPGMLAYEADGQTLRWPGVLDAVGYNVYRGELATLADLDLNGLPDGGYGACVSGADPDTTDTVFTDTSLPPAGGGYFYLRSVVTTIAEDLGSTSAGLTRTPTTWCP